MLADLTTKNPNVFYELGLAHAIAKPVVLVANSIEDVPFDLRGLRILIYDKDDEGWGPKLGTAIKKSLAETMTDVIGAVPPMFLGRGKIERPSEDPTRSELRRLSEEMSAIRAEMLAGRPDGGFNLVEIVDQRELYVLAVKLILNADPDDALVQRLLKALGAVHVSVYGVTKEPGRIKFHPPFAADDIKSARIALLKSPDVLDVEIDPVA